MPSAANIRVHPSQFPENIRRDLLKSLRTRQVNHKFHYDSIKQAQKWLALHEAHSPARRDKDCLATYDRAFVEAVKQIKAKQIHVIGLGCGGGQKDTRLLKLLKVRGKEISYTPCDVSAAMTLVAEQKALSAVADKNCFPFVCDLATADDLTTALAHRPSPIAHRLVTFFSMIPNFEPKLILPKLASLIRQKDFLLFSANLAPGKNYAAGMKKILPQYDNPLTRDWLMTFLLDLGVERGDGKLLFGIETGTLGLKRVVARFHFTQSRRIEVGEKQFDFRRGESIRLFFSYRYTPALVRRALEKYGLKVCEEWGTRSGEESVFLCRRK